MNNLQAYQDVPFTSSTTKTPEFQAFARVFRSELTRMLGDEFQIRQFTEGHFYLSGFLQNRTTGKIAYFATGDVRFTDWYSRVLVRPAQDIHDYTGGANRFCRCDDIAVTAHKVTA